MANIRAKAVCLFRRGNKILLSEGHNPEGDQDYLIPIGGGVEFGEYAKDAAIRETFEEIQAVAINLRLLGISENIFSFDEKPGHEIVFVYEGDFEDESLYGQEEIQGVEDNGWQFKCRWFDLVWLRENHLPFYPDGILEML